MINDDLKKRNEWESGLLSRWTPALNKVGVSDEHKAITTAIVLENYLNYLTKDQRLIAEDQIQTNAFTGIHLALLGLLSRAVPELIAADFVGMQAMPTPTSRIFVAKWFKSHDKGATLRGDELFVGDTADFRTPESYIDPYYTSGQVRFEPINSDGTLRWANQLNSVGRAPKDGKDLPMRRPFIFAKTMELVHVAADGTKTAKYIPGDATFGYDKSGTLVEDFFTGVDVQYLVNTGTGVRSIEVTGTMPAGTLYLNYDYDGESEGNIPEFEFDITDSSVEVIRRQLRGKYSLDAEYDLNVLHGLNLGNELTNHMKQELMAEINREIVNDVRALAMIGGIVKTLDFDTVFSGLTTSISGNYDDTHKLILDAINMMCAKIQTQGRMGRGNFVIANPETLSFLNRVPGFVGSGVTYTGRDITYLGALGGRIKFYADPYYPFDELLIGFKGTGALETGYMHCPYLPITATPTLLNQQTGDPSKLFFTRYAKTLNRKLVGNAFTYDNVILQGQYQYAILKLKNYPGVNMFS